MRREDVESPQVCTVSTAGPAPGRGRRRRRVPTVPGVRVVTAPTVGHGRSHGAAGSGGTSSPARHSIPDARVMREDQVRSGSGPEFGEGRQDLVGVPVGTDRLEHPGHLSRRVDEVGAADDAERLLAVQRFFPPGAVLLRHHMVGI